MRTVAALPACALIAGAALGLSLSDPHLLAASLILVASLSVAYAGWLTQRPLVLASGVTAVFFVGGAALGSVA